MVAQPWLGGARARRPNSNASLQRSRRAFTLIELLVVIAVIGVLAAPAARGPKSARGGPAHAVHEQSQAARPGLPELSRCEWLLPAGRSRSVVRLHGRRQAAARLSARLCILGSVRGRAAEHRGQVPAVLAHRPEPVRTERRAVDSRRQQQRQCPFADPLAVHNCGTLGLAELHPAADRTEHHHDRPLDRERLESALCRQHQRLL